jgi:hypothetical protein
MSGAHRRAALSRFEHPASNRQQPLQSLITSGADDGIRTRDLRFTKPLLYQLSYVGAPSGEDYIETIRQQAAESVCSLCSGGTVMRPGPKQPFQRRDECSAAFGFSGARHQHRTNRPIHDAPGQIAHDIMA